MLWLWILVYIIVGLGLLLLVAAVILHRVGSAMPEAHSHTCSITLQQPAEPVYTAIAGVPAWPQWDPGVNRVEGQADSAGVFRGRLFMGRNIMKIESRPVAPPTRHEISVEDERMKIFVGTWRYELTPLPGGCRVTLTEDGRILSPIPRAMARRLADPMMYLKRHLRLLARKFGENARIEVPAPTKS